MKAFHEVRSYDSDFMVWHSAYENISFLAHWHKEIELIYIRSGQCRLTVSDQTFLARAGDCMICESGSIHYSDSFDLDNSLDFIIFDTSILSSMFQNPHFSRPLITREELDRYGLTRELAQLISLVSRELAEKQAYYQEVVEASLCRFWNLLKRHHPRSTEYSPAENRREHMLMELQELLNYIDSHYTNNISLEYAAARMNFSPSYFSRVFKNLMGINFVTYLNLVRVEQAARRLRESNGRVTDVALDCGFNNIRTFNRVFKEITGFTPSAFLLQPDPDAYKMTYYYRRSLEKQFVENDSLTIISHEKGQKNNDQKPV
ncbi:MAG: AraC family transcriptional regulator [Lachnospiraceae bacterium]|jgi:AraC-like DNA-binding protein|nr:AraC family transcriptional regulator [Lachnospiraceae bacterium]MCI8997153.1 AraC family transcriptional regulator [Lachnospiraceae bacterium]MCI9133030.1 AraC family transcriptional regulator [Lachnospiraceae bacterium]